MKKIFALIIVCSLFAVRLSYAADDAAVNQGIKKLNAHAQSDADKKLVLKAVAQQTAVAENTLQSQMRSTGLSYGDLLVANSLAEGSHKSLANVVALKSKGWANAAVELKIAPSSVIDRLNTAEKMVQVWQRNPKQAANTKNQNNMNGQRVSEPRAPVSNMGMKY